MNLWGLIPQPIRQWLRQVVERVPVQGTFRPWRPAFPGEQHRLQYQERLVNFNIRPGARVLDIDSGGDPFRYATVLFDRFLEPTLHRHGSLVRNGKPLLCGVGRADRRKALPPAAACVL